MWSRNRPFTVTSHLKLALGTVALFYAKTAKEEPLNSKGRLEIFFVSCEDVVGKAGLPKGWLQQLCSSRQPTRRDWQQQQCSRLPIAVIHERNVISIKRVNTVDSA